MQNKAWLITQGQYSDYHIVGVFTSVENAQLIESKRWLS